MKAPIRTRLDITSRTARRIIVEVNNYKCECGAGADRVVMGEPMCALCAHKRYKRSDLGRGDAIIVAKRATKEQIRVGRIMEEGLMDRRVRCGDHVIVTSEIGSVITCPVCGVQLLVPRGAV